MKRDHSSFADKISVREVLLYGHVIANYLALIVLYDAKLSFIGHHVLFA
jgi:hypothetical protein